MPQARVLLDVERLLLAKDCRACRKQVGLILVRIAEGVDGDATRWCDFQWHRTDLALVAGPQRSRRADPHVKQYLLHQGIAEGHGRTTGEIVKGMSGVQRQQAIQWRDCELSAYKASSTLSFVGEQHIAVAFDGARFRPPAREVMLIVCSATGPGDPTTCVLPPQVPIGQGVMRYSEGEVRYLAEAQVLGEPRPRKRACVMLADGSRVWELPLRLDGGGGERIAPVLHMSSDQGPGGSPAKLWMLGGLGLGTALYPTQRKRLACCSWSMR